MAAAAIGAGASLLGGLVGGKGAKKAAQAQLAAQQQALQQQQAQFAQTRSDYMPYLEAGQGALGAQQTLVGLNGNDAQLAAIEALKGSPGFTSLYNTGSDTILQNAAATGGLRGGNTQNSLAQFGSGLLAQVIQNQLGSLGGIAGMGSQAVGGISAAGQNNSNAQSQIYGQIGNANAVKAGAPYSAFAGALQGIGQNAGGLSGLFGGGGGGFNPGAVMGATNATLANVPHSF